LFYKREGITTARRRGCRMTRIRDMKVIKKENDKRRGKVKI